MPSSITDLLVALTDGVSAINNLSQHISTAFPTGTVVTSVSTIGTITFSSSLASGFLLVVTSSGATYKIPLYPAG